MQRCFHPFRLGWVFPVALGHHAQHVPCIGHPVKESPVLPEVAIPTGTLVGLKHVGVFLFEHLGHSSTHDPNGIHSTHQRLGGTAEQVTATNTNYHADLLVIELVILEERVSSCYP